MDLQHLNRCSYCFADLIFVCSKTFFLRTRNRRDLLLEAGNKLASQVSEMDPEGAATVLLIYAFFSVKNPGSVARWPSPRVWIRDSRIEESASSPLVPLPIPPCHAYRTRTLDGFIAS